MFVSKHCGFHAKAILKVISCLRGIAFLILHFTNISTQNNLQQVSQMRLPVRKQSSHHGCLIMLFRIYVWYYTSWRLMNILSLTITRVLEFGTDKWVNEWPPESPQGSQLQLSATEVGIDKHCFVSHDC